MSEWKKIRKRFVFKPADGSGSKGVYLGEKISMKKLEELSSDSVAQEYCPPPHGVSDPHSDESHTKYDFRVITRDCDILGVMTRHFTGQVMEMRSFSAGFRMALREKECWCVFWLGGRVCFILSIIFFIFSFPTPFFSFAHLMIDTSLPSSPLPPSLSPSPSIPPSDGSNVCIYCGATLPPLEALRLSDDVAP